MTDIDSLAAALFGSKRAESQEVLTDATTRTYVGTALTDSKDGTVMVDLGGDVTLPDDVEGVSEHSAEGIEVSTGPGVRAGDEVVVTLVGGTPLKTPMVTGVAGEGDGQNERIHAIEADYVKATTLEADVAEIGFLKADSATIADLQADTAKVHDLTAAQLSAATAYIASLNAKSVTAETLAADVAKVHDLTADGLSAAAAYIAQLSVDSVTAQRIAAISGDFDTVRANAAKVANLTAAELEADHATVGSLSTTYASIANLNAANGRITNLESTKANISDLEADYIKADEIEATYMHANMSNSDVAWIENGTIKNGAIVSAMINDVSANKLTAGTINGSVINVTNLNADNITTGTINGQRIGEGSLSLDKLSESVYTEAEVNNIVDGLNDRIDGAIETFTGTAVPTLNNQPASSWNTTKLRDEHVGDVYYVVNSQSQQNGYCYRFTKSGSTYSWQLIKDSDVTAALSRLTTAEGKITTFDSDISKLKTDTGTLTTKTESLETRMSDAESDILDKVDTTTFNEVSDTVDQHSQTLSQHTTAISNKADSSTVTAVTNRVSKNEQDISGINTTIGELQDTVETKADGSTVSTISNKLNTVSDTVDGHTQTLTSVQNALSTKADQSTVTTLSNTVNTVKQTADTNKTSITNLTQTVSDNKTAIETRASTIEQNLDGFKTAVSETYTTKTELGEAVDNRVDVDGEFLYRTTGGGQDIPNGRATIQSVWGNTLVWNQLVDGSAFVGRDAGGITAAYANGKYTIDGTTTGYIEVHFVRSFSMASGHKYLFLTNHDKGNTYGDKFFVYDNKNSQRVADLANLWYSRIFTADKTYEDCEFDFVQGTASYEIHDAFTMSIFDLTAMFGAGNEPATVDEFEAMFPEPYYPYDAGSLLPVRMEGIETTGFNLWDEVAEDGYIYDTTGENAGSNVAYLRSKDYIPVFPSMAYHFTCTTGNNGGKVYYYDADKAFLSFEGVNCNGPDKITPATARYMRFWLNYPGSYNHDICINISGSRNGEYEPYQRSERAIPASTYFPDGMRSAGSVYDELTASEAITRVGEVNLGTLNWSELSSPGSHIWRVDTSQLPAAPKQVSWNVLPVNAITIGYTVKGYAPISGEDDKFFAIGNNRLVIIDHAYSTVDAFAASLNGKKMHYAIATPTATLIDPPLNMTYRAESGGTERIMVDATISAPQSAPVPMSIQYGINIYETAAEDAMRTASLESRVTTAESTIEQHSDSIALKANSADVYTKQQSDGLISTEVTNRNAAITAATEAIELNVSQNYATKTELSDGLGDANDYTDEQVTATKAAIKVTTDGISTEVSKKVNGTEVISAINQSAETVKIQASRVEIDGTAVFSAISSDVDDAITGKGYQTSSQVESAITGKGYQTSSQVESAITSKGYATTTQAQGYASTAKSEAISAAATDATTKANAAEANAKAYTDALEIGGRNLLRNTDWNAETIKNFTTAAIGNRMPGDYIGVWYKESNVILSFTDNGYLNISTSASSGRYGIVQDIYLDHGTYTLSASADDSGCAITIGTAQWPTTNLLLITDKSRKSISFEVKTASNYRVYIVDNNADSSTIKNPAVNWVKLERGNHATDWTPAPEDIEANAVKRTQRIWYRTNASSAPATPGTASSNWVTKADDGNDAWTKMHIAISSTHKYIYTCEQYEMANGTVGYTSVLLDNTITVIDGGNIITGSVKANTLDAADINASKTLTVGAMTDAAASTILNSNVQVGGTNRLINTANPTNDKPVRGYGCNASAVNGGSLSYSDGVGTYTVGSTADIERYIRIIPPDSNDNLASMGLPSKGDFVLSGYVKTNTTGNGLCRLHVRGQFGTTAWQNAAFTNLLTGETVPSAGSVNIVVGAKSEWTPFAVKMSWSRLEATRFYISLQMYNSASTSSLDDSLKAGDTFQFKKLKLEKGNKATDWTPAPEDMATAESLAGTNESLEGAIEDIGELSDQLVGTVTEQNKTITTIQTYLNSLRKDLDAEIQSRQQWLNFNAAEGLVIGAAGSSFKTVTTNTSQQFRSGGTVLAETSGTEFVAPVMRSDQLLIGNWMWTRRDNGNLSLKWIG